MYNDNLSALNRYSLAMCWEHHINSTHTIVINDGTTRVLATSVLTQYYCFTVVCLHYYGWFLTDLFKLDERPLSSYFEKRNYMFIIVFDSKKALWRILKQFCKHVFGWKMSDVVRKLLSPALTSIIETSTWR